MKMRARRNIDRFSESTKARISKQMLMRNKGLLMGAIRQGLLIKGWMSKGHPRYQVAHVDMDNPRINFFVSIGMPMPDELITKRRTVGSTTQLMGYLKLHIPTDQRELSKAEDEAVKVEDE